MPLSCRIELFGGLRVSVGSRIVDRFQTQRTAALLAYLALENGKSVPREVMARTLWPEGDGTSVRNRLNQAVSSLRRQLHPPEFTGLEILVANYHAVALNMNAALVDVHQFETSLKEAEQSRDLKTRIKLLSDAIDLYNGPCLPGFNDDWAIVARGRFDRQYLAALDLLVRTYSRTGQPERAVAYALKRVAMMPTDEGGHVTIVELFLRANDTAAAHRYYMEADQVLLANRIHASPGWATLKDRVAAASRQSVSKLPKSTPSTRDALLESDEAERKPAQKQWRLDRVPKPMNSFLGRHDEIALLYQKLDEGCRMLTLYGLTGSGRSRLALQFAHEVHERGNYDVRSCFIPAEERPETVIESIVQQLLGLRERPRDPLSEAADLGPQHSTLLVISQVFENHPKLISDLEGLLQALPQLVLIVVAAEPTYLAGEVQMSVQPFWVPERLEAQPLPEIAQNPAVRLFVDRAQAVRPDFQITSRVSQSVVQICRELDGIPLLIEFAAGWIRTLTASQILDNLRSSSGFLERRRRDVAPRQRVVMATLENSIALASEEVGRALSRFQVFEGGWDREAGMALCENLNYDECIESLVDRSLIVRNGGRHTMLSLAKNYVFERTSPHDLMTYRSLHAQIYAQRAEDVLKEQAILKDYLSDFSNYRLSIRWHLQNGQVEQAARMVFALGRLWEAGSLFPEAVELIKLMREATEGGTFGLATAYLDAVEGRVRWLQGEFNEAARLLESAVQQLTEAGAHEDSLGPQCDLIAESHRRKQFDEVSHLLDRVLKLSQHYDNLPVQSRVFLALGNAACDQRRLVDAEQYYRRSLAFAEKQGNQTRQCMALVNLANLMLLSDKVDLAEKMIEESERAAVEIDIPWVLSMALLTRARVYRSRSRFSDAIRTIAQAIELARYEGLVRWRLISEAAKIAAAMNHNAVAIQLLAFAERANVLLITREQGAEFEAHYETVDQLRRETSDDFFQQQWLRGEWLREAEVVELIHRVTNEGIAKESV